MHLGVVKVGLLKLAKPEIISLFLVSAKKTQCYIELWQPLLHLELWIGATLNLLKISENNMYVHKTKINRYRQSRATKI